MRNALHRVVFRVFLLTGLAFSIPRAFADPLTPWQIAGIRAAFGDSREPLVEASEAVQGEALVLCAERGWGAVLDAQEVEAYLHSPNPAIQMAAIRAIGQMGAEGDRFAASVADLLRDPSLSSGAMLAIERTLSGLNPGRVAPLIYDRDERVCRAALFAIASRIDEKGLSAKEDAAVFQTPAFVSRVAELADDSNPGVRNLALQLLALLAIYDETAATRFVPHLSDPLRISHGMPLASVHFLLGVRGAAFASDVAAVLDNEDPIIRKLAVSVLGLMGGQGAIYAENISTMMKTARGELYSACASSLAAFGKPGLEFAPTLLDALNDRADRNTAHTISALGLMSKLDPSLAQYIRPLLDDPKPLLRAVAVESLGDMGEVGADFIPAIAEKLDDQDGDVRRKALLALRKSGKRAVVFLPEISAKLDDHNAWVRRAAILALADLKIDRVKSAPKIAERLKDESLVVRITAAVALNKMGEGKAFGVDFVTPEAKQEAEARIGDLTDVEVWQNVSAEDLFPMLYHEDAAVRLFAGRLLDGRGNPSQDWNLQAAFLAGLHDAPAERITELRAHLRFWSGNSPDLQNVVTWLGRPDVEPLPKGGVSVNEAHKILAVFAKIWKPASGYPALREELAGRIAQISKSIVGSADAETAQLLQKLESLVKDPVPDLDPMRGAEAKRVVETVEKIQAAAAKVLDETHKLDAAVRDFQLHPSRLSGMVISADDSLLDFEVGSRIWRAMLESDPPKDLFGHEYAPFKADEPVRVPRETYEALKPFVSANFWGPYAPEPAGPENK